MYRTKEEKWQHKYFLAKSTKPKVNKVLLKICASSWLQCLQNATKSL